MPDSFSPIGADGEHIDCYLGSYPDSDVAWVIDQVDASTGKFDEHKVFLFYRQWSDAQADYLAAFSDGKGHLRMGTVTSMPIADLKAWLGDGDMTKPLALKFVTVGTGLTHYDQGSGQWQAPFQNGERVPAVVTPKAPDGTTAANFDPRQAPPGDRPYLQRAAKSEVGEGSPFPFPMTTGTPGSISKAGRLQPNFPYESAQNREAAAKYQTVIAAAFAQLRPKVVSQVRAALDKLGKAYVLPAPILAEFQPYTADEVPYKYHGHLRPNPIGARARCGGPRMCSMCWDEYRALYGHDYIGKRDVSDEERDERGRWTTGEGGDYLHDKDKGGWTVAGDASHPDAQRLNAMRVPPQWSDVRLNPDKNAALQVVGKDAKGRSQYLYSAEHSQQAAAEKFARGRDFNERIGDIRKQISSDFRSKDEAKVLYVIDKTGFRVGSDRETGGDKKAYGASTLVASQIKIDGDKVRFSFIGKKGVRITQSVEDHRLATMLAPRVAAGGRIFQTDYAKVSGYMRQVGGGDFKIKDFRTWHGTNMAMQAMRGIAKPKNEREYTRAVKAVAKEVAGHLGNTPSVALRAYIDPAVFSPWEKSAHMTKAQDDFASMDELYSSVIYHGPQKDWRTVSETGDDPDDDDTVEKGVEDEARDEHGRWTAGGDGPITQKLTTEQLSRAAKDIAGRMESAPALSVETRGVDNQEALEQMSHAVTNFAADQKYAETPEEEPVGAFVFDDKGAIQGAGHASILAGKPSGWNGLKWPGEGKGAAIGAVGSTAKGAGAAIEHSLIEQLRARGVEMVILTAQNGSRPFHEKMGFKSIGSNKNEMYLDLRTAATKIAKADDGDEDLDWALAAEIADGLDLSTLNVLVEQGGQLGASVAGNSGRVSIAQFGFTDTSQMVNQIDQRAADWAKERAAEMVGMRWQNGQLVPSADAKKRIDLSTRNMVRDTIYSGLQDGKRSTEIADDLEGAGKYPFSEARAALIANSEIATAHSQGALESFYVARDNGVNTKKSWLVADAPCPICEENGDAGAIDLEDEFPSGDLCPQAHPHCLCVLLAEVIGVDEEKVAKAGVD